MSLAVLDLDGSQLHPSGIERENMGKVFSEERQRKYLTGQSGTLALNFQVRSYLVFLVDKVPP
jgi:hypothetical protein